MVVASMRSSSEQSRLILVEAGRLVRSLTCTTVHHHPYGVLHRANRLRGSLEPLTADRKLAIRVSQADGPARHPRNTFPEPL